MCGQRDSRIEFQKQGDVRIVLETSAKICGLGKLEASPRGADGAQG